MTEYASFSVEQHNYDNLIAGQGQDGRSVEIAEGILERGTVLGKLKHQKGTVDFVGTGNGGIDPNITLNKKVEIGAYEVEITEAVTDGGKFKVTTPGGLRLKDGEVGVLYSSDHLNFAINDGSVDFAVGDKWTINVIAHDNAGKYVISNADAHDGSEIPDLVLAHKADATTAPVKSYAYHELKANKYALVYGTGHDAVTVQNAFDENGRSIYLKDAVV